MTSPADAKVEMVPDAKLPFDLRLVRDGRCIAKVYGVDAKPDRETAERLRAALEASADTPTEATCSTCEGKGVYDSYDGDGRAFEFECYTCNGTGKATPIASVQDEVTLGVGDGSGQLFVHGSYEAIKRVQKMIFDLERLTPTADHSLVEALEFYANPEIYKPHPHGSAFDDRDLSFKAKAVLTALRKQP